MLPLQSHDIPAPLTSKAPTPNATAICLVPFTPVPLNAPTYSPLGLTSRLNPSVPAPWQQRSITAVSAACTHLFTECNPLQSDLSNKPVAAD